MSFVYLNTFNRLLSTFNVINIPLVNMSKESCEKWSWVYQKNTPLLNIGHPYEYILEKYF